MRGFSATVVFAVVLTLAGRLSADEVFFNNGDHLTGAIETLADGKLKIKSTVAGEVTVNMKDVKTFSTGGSIWLHLSDGTVIHQRVVAGEAGQVSIAPGGVLQPQNVRLAQIQKVNPPPVKWTGNVVIGGLIARGNTDIDTLNFTAHAQRQDEVNRMTLDAGYLYSRQKPAGGGEKKRTEDNAYFAASYDRFFTKKLYSYANVRAERDLLADLSLRLTPGVGVGYQWFDNPNDLNFNTEGGVSWLYRSFSNDGTDESVAIRLAYHLTKKFNEQFTIFHDFEYFPGLDSIDDFFFDTDAGVRAKLTDRLFSEFKIEYRHDERPAPGALKDDLRYTLGVGWNF